MKNQLLDSQAMLRMMKRMTHEIMEKNDSPEHIVFVGIKTRGEFIARRMVQQMKELYNVDIPFETLDISNFRDDKPASGLPTGIESDLTGKIVILVDDVLFTGRTIRAALDALVKHGRPKRIQLLTLVDRGHREYPIRSDYVGKNLPTSKSEIIDVFIKEVDGEDAIYLSKE